MNIMFFYNIVLISLFSIIPISCRTKTCTSIQNDFINIKSSCLLDPCSLLISAENGQNAKIDNKIMLNCINTAMIMWFSAEKSLTIDFYGDESATRPFTLCLHNSAPIGISVYKIERNKWLFVDTPVCIQSEFDDKITLVYENYHRIRKYNQILIPYTIKHLNYA
jgi:hypothetical protein